MAEGIVNQAWFGQNTKPSETTLDFDLMAKQHKARLEARDKANPPVPETPSEELSRLEEWKTQLSQRLSDGESSVNKASAMVHDAERRLDLLKKEFTKERPRPLRPFEVKKFEARIAQFEENVRVAKDFFTRMTGINKSAVAESKRFPQKRYNELRKETFEADQQRKALRGESTGSIKW